MFNAINLFRLQLIFKIQLNDVYMFQWQLIIFIIFSFFGKLFKLRKFIAKINVQKEKKQKKKKQRIYLFVLLDFLIYFDFDQLRSLKKIMYFNFIKCL